jgi:HEAT repeat protein
MHSSTLLFAASLTLLQLPGAVTQGDELAAERAAARARYLKVEAELSRASLDALAPEQRAARARLLDVLDAYVVRADFGVQELAPGSRLPQFVDFEGRRCAIAELLHATGESALVDAVAAQRNTAWIADLSEDAQFLGWLERHGLALDEAARIQGPSMPRLPREPVPGDTVPTSPSGPSAPSSPGAGAPSAPGAGSPRGPGGFAPPSAPASPGASGPSAPASPGGPGGPAAFSEIDSTWPMWWEYNKIEFLRPNRFELSLPGDDAPGRTTTSHLDFMRRAMSGTLLRGLEHRDARIRAAAAGALGRIGGADAVEKLVPLLGDAHVTVQQAALLGLGATGAAQAQKVLLKVAEHGKLGQLREFGRRERALAIVALGLGRRVGFDAGADDAVANLAKDCLPSEQEDFGVAAMTYALLAPCEKLTALARQFADDGRLPMTVRSRATEALREREDAATLGVLQHLASGSRLELRRAAALALGEFDHPLVVAGLMTAHDLEKEPVASSFQLVSLGRRGGEKAREHLVAVLRGKDAIERPWAALALGMLARRDGDAAAAKALLEALPSVKNADDRPAYWLALGLSRAPQALDVLRKALGEAADPRARMYAAQALALLGGDAVREALLAQLESERSPLVRSQLALALGVLGQADDLDEIVATLDAVREPALQGQVAAAIAFHGSSAALAKLGSLLASENLDPAARAAAMDGLGMMLTRGPALALNDSSRSANYPLFPNWLREVYATTF